MLAASHKAAAAARDGAAAEKRDGEKTAAYAARGDSSFKFIPFSVGSLGRLGKPAISFVARLGRKASAASEGTFSAGQFVDGVLQEVAVILARYNARMENAVASHVLRPPGCEYARAAAGVSCDVADGS